MNEFEKKYYEASSFWEDGMLEDPANAERFRITSEMIPNEAGSILDVGCGNGVFINALQKAKPQLRVCGLDRSEHALQYVKTEKVQGEISKLPFPDASFDCVTCLEVIEHLPLSVYEESLKELARVSKKYLIVSVPYKEVLENSYTQCPSCRTIFNHELHLRNFDDEKVVELFSKYGYRNIDVVKAGMSLQFKFHTEFRKMFYPEQFRQWKSPICPMCGYEEKVKTSVHSSPTMSIKKERKMISFLSFLPKRIWPKEKKYYWIIGLFQKEETVK